MNAPTPSNESERIDALHSANILDTPRERVFDDLARLACRLIEAPLATVSLVDTERQWFKARVGICSTETPRNISFCAHTILSSEPLIVPDAAADPRFSDSPLVTQSPFIRFYAGVPLMTPDGFALGAFCVLDSTPRDLTFEQIDTLKMLARVTAALIDQRRMLNLTTV